jgi:hypothetical protein
MFGFLNAYSCVTCDCDKGSRWELIWHHVLYCGDASAGPREAPNSFHLKKTSTRNHSENGEHCQGNGFWCWNAQLQGTHEFLSWSVRVQAVTLLLLAIALWGIRTYVAELGNRLWQMRLEAVGECRIAQHLAVAIEVSFRMTVLLKPRICEHICNEMVWNVFQSISSISNRVPKGFNATMRFLSVSKQELNMFHSFETRFGEMFQYV